MENGMNTYLDFAENDYMFFRHAYDSGNKGTALAALGQNICERYLKHIVSENMLILRLRKKYKKNQVSSRLIVLTD